MIPKPRMKWSTPMLEALILRHDAHESYAYMATELGTTYLKLNAALRNRGLSPESVKRARVIVLNPPVNHIAWKPPYYGFTKECWDFVSRHPIKLLVKTK